VVWAPTLVPQAFGDDWADSEGDDGVDDYCGDGLICAFETSLPECDAEGADPKEEEREKKGECDDSCQNPAIISCDDESRGEREDVCGGDSEKSCRDGVDDPVFDFEVDDSGENDSEDSGSCTLVKHGEDSFSEPR